MKQLLTICFLMLGLFCSAQKNQKDKYVSKSGHEFKVGDKIELGAGTMQNGNFKFIFYGGSVFEGVTDGMYGTSNSKQRSLNKKYSFKTVEIDKIKKGSIYFKDRSIGYYEIRTEAAIQAGELIIPEKDIEKQNKKSDVNSVADEIAKLKKLYDEGTITKEEFEAQKKKLLN